MINQTSVRPHPDDNIAITLGDLGAGEAAADYTLADPVKRGHKIASQAIAAGQITLRYGQIIGAATCDIAQGAHVHVHNLAMADDSNNYAFGTQATPLPPITQARHFQGYRRADGQSGTRHYLGVLTSVNCSDSVVRFIAEQAEKTDWFRALENVDGIVPIVHSSGCGMSGQDEGYDSLFRTLQGYARNPNFVGILLVGLGCEVMQILNLIGKM